MSTVGLFVAGALVTLLVTAAMGLLFWGAILDGRTQRAVEQAEQEIARQKDGKRLKAVDAA